MCYVAFSRKEGEKLARVAYLSISSLQLFIDLTLCFYHICAVLGADLRGGAAEVGKIVFSRTTV